MLLICTDGDVVEAIEDVVGNGASFNCDGDDDDDDGVVVIGTTAAGVLSQLIWLSSAVLFPLEAFEGPSTTVSPPP